MTCVRLLFEAEQLLEGVAEDSEAQRVFRSLRREFAADYRAATDDRPGSHFELDSVYERSLGIAGTPLNDSFHFGQTWTNDYGRPYQGGLNQIAGFTARAERGRFSLSVRGEYQRAPGRAAYAQPVREAIAVMDGNAVAEARAMPGVSAFRLLDATLSANIANHTISVGKSEYWWGPAAGGAFGISNNAEPIYALRINRTEPLFLPLLSRLLGPVRYDLFVGRLEGHQSPIGPWLQGQKVSFKPSPNFEFGVYRTIVFAGKGHVPFTFGSFWNSFTSFSNVPVEQKFSRSDPGARYSGMEFSYRVPYLRDWLTLYTDALSHDDPSPLAAPRRAAFRPGIFVSRLPGASRVDLRVEAVYTDIPTSRSLGGKFFFFEAAYHDAYTMKQMVLGDWIGREGKGVQAWLRWHLSPREMVELSYRNAKSAPDFVPGGTTQNLWGAKVVRRIGEDLEMSTFAQYERWKAPILAPGARNDVSIGLQLTYWPALQWKPR